MTVRPRVDPRHGRLAHAIAERRTADALGAGLAADRVPGARGGAVGVGAVNRRAPDRIWVVVPCKGRLAHLRRSLQRVLETTDFHVCLVDFSCPDDAGGWFEAEYGDRSGERKLIVERVGGQEFFSKSAAHNAGAWRALREGADFLCFLDADTLIAPDFSGFVRARARLDCFLIAGLRADGTDEPSMTGLLVAPAARFAELGGFDESFRGWGAEDIEMRMRLHVVGGLQPVDVPLAMTTPIAHDNELRTRFYEQADPAASNAANLDRILEKIRGPWRASHRLDLPSMRRLWFQRPDPFAPSVGQDTGRLFVDPPNEGPPPPVRRGKITCLCVTENRAAFMPWIVWSFERQTYAHKELLILDSSPVPFRTDRPDVRVIPMPPGTNVPTKRNRALEQADGEYIAWFDDDDWQHPERLTRLERALAQSSAAYAGCSRSYFIDVHSDGVRSYDGHGHLIFNGALFRRDAVRRVRFDETKRRASDTTWLQHLVAHAGSPLVLRDAILCAWLSHESNISNPRTRRRFPEGLASLEARLGPNAWAETSERLVRLRATLPLPSTVAPATPRAAALHQTLSRTRQGRRFEREPAGSHPTAALPLASGPAARSAALVTRAWNARAHLRVSIADASASALAPWRCSLSSALGVQWLDSDEQQEEFAVFARELCVVRSRYDSFFEEAVRRLRRSGGAWVGCFPARSGWIGGRRRTGPLVDRAILGPAAVFNQHAQLYLGGDILPSVVVVRAELARRLQCGELRLSDLPGGVVASQDAWTALPETTPGTARRSGKSRDVEWTGGLGSKTTEKCR